MSLCGACAAPARERVPVLSEHAVVLELPLVEPGDDRECGLVSVSAPCRWSRAALSNSEELDLSRLAQENEGLSGGELCALLARNGFEAFVFEGTLDRGPTGLFTQVDAQRPVLVMITPDENTRHCVLFVGYDEPTRTACLLDPERGRVVYPYDAFEKEWKGCDHFTLLAIPKDWMQRHGGSS